MLFIMFHSPLALNCHWTDAPFWPSFATKSFTSQGRPQIICPKWFTWPVPLRSVRLPRNSLTREFSRRSSHHENSTKLEIGAVCFYSKHHQFDEALFRFQRFQPTVKAITMWLDESACPKAINRSKCASVHPVISEILFEIFRLNLEL